METFTPDQYDRLNFDLMVKVLKGGQVQPENNHKLCVDVQGSWGADQVLVAAAGLFGFETIAELDDQNQEDTFLGQPVKFLQSPTTNCRMASVRVSSAKDSGFVKGRKFRPCQLVRLEKITLTFVIRNLLYGWNTFRNIFIQITVPYKTARHPGEKFA